MILVFRDIRFIPKFEEGHPERWRWMRVGGLGTNWRCSTFKPPYLPNNARYDKGYYWSLIGNRIRAFNWYQNRRPWLTLKWPWTAMHSVALHSCFSEPTTKIWMKIDLYYQRQKGSPGRDPSFASSVHCLPNILHTWSHDSFHMMRQSMTLAAWRYFKAIRLCHIKFLKNGAW